MIRETVLIVEDDRVYAAYLQQILTELAYIVKGPVATGEEAVAMAAELRPDLILMDIELAGEMDGIAAAEKITDIVDVPIIYLTGYLHEAMFEETLATAPHGCMTKPVPEWKLAGMIEMALHRHAFNRGFSRKTKQPSPIS